MRLLLGGALRAALGAAVGGALHQRGAGAVLGGGQHPRLARADRAAHTHH